MDLFSNIVAGFGLAAPAGLNAWLPLLIVGLAGKLNFIKLTAPFDILTNIWVLLVLVILLTIEIFADKIPAIELDQRYYSHIHTPRSGRYSLRRAERDGTRYGPHSLLRAGRAIGGQRSRGESGRQATDNSHYRRAGQSRGEFY